jgi:outer membrane protein assembly factor BamA
VNGVVNTILVTCCVLLAGVAIADVPEGPQNEPKLPSTAELEARGAIIGQILFDKQNVFDTSKPGENNSLYRLANRWHIITRDSVIRHQLLFGPGDLFSGRLLQESERLLRKNVFFYDVKVEPVRYENGVVDIRVRTRDLWTLMPGISISRSGGENRVRFSLSERNLLGRGVSLRANYVDNVDRESTSIEYFDRNLGRTWTSLFLEFADSSDGNTSNVRLIRPFYQLDARWSAGGTFYENTREVSFYDLGNEAAEYAADTDSHSAFFGWSPGLQDGWVRRWTAGLVYDSNDFSAAPEGVLPAVIPVDRKLVYPFLGVELLEDRFESTSNRDQIERTEDFYLGTRLWASVGYATEDFGADRESVLYRFEASSGFGSMEKKALLLSSSLTGRLDEGKSANSEISLNARYYNQISDKRLFFMTLDASAGDNLDLDNLVDLGGDTGLRGYPLRYQTGESRALLTIEERYFTDWYPFRLFRVGGAAFIDIGRVWGDSPLGNEPLGWLKDIGLGLRLAPTRASGRDVIHIDVAFPLDGDPTIDNVQFLIQSKRSF